MFARSVCMLGSLFAILTVNQPAWSQESRATVVGRVTDSSGSVIPAATVSFTNVETGVTVKAQTNGEGNYFSSFLIPGTYRIVGEKSGFKSLVRSGITLSVNDRLELNLPLELGSQTETVVVSADASLIDTVNANSGRVIAAQEVLDLPIHLGDVDN